jgi:hypothetical protein
MDAIHQLAMAALADWVGAVKEAEMLAWSSVLAGMILVFLKRMRTRMKNNTLREVFLTWLL